MLVGIFSIELFNGDFNFNYFYCRFHSSLRHRNMCTSSVQLFKQRLKYARFKGASDEVIAELERKVKESEELERIPKLYVANAFQHPSMAVLSIEDNQIDLRKHFWGLIPPFVKSEVEARELWNKTINARGESIFDKPAFSHAANFSRCIVPLDGYFEYHHRHGKTFPYLIQQEDESMMYVGGLTAKWTAPSSGKLVRTFTLITTPATDFLAEIHNNPKREDARMPLLLEPENIEQWLNGSVDEAKSLIKTNETALKAHTVNKLMGKESKGNTPEALESHDYPELQSLPGLFD